MTFHPWKIAVPEVLRKTPPITQLRRAREILRSWHLSSPSQVEVDRLAHLVESTVPGLEGLPTSEAPSDGSIDLDRHLVLHHLLLAAEDFRLKLMQAIQACEESRV